MGKVVARKWRIITARIPNAVVNGIMPVVIVVGVCSVPTTVVRLQRVMRPANACICTRYNNPLSRESESPDVRRVCVSNPRLDRIWSLRL